jgi:hypothetical protein
MFVHVYRQIFHTFPFAHRAVTCVLLLQPFPRGMPLVKAAEFILSLLMQKAESLKHQNPGQRLGQEPYSLHFQPERLTQTTISLSIFITNVD